MATIVRVKRRRDADPLDVLHLATKKARRSADESEAASSSVPGNLFKLAGTVISKDSGVSQKVRDAIRKEKLEKEYKRHQADVLGELHTRNREQNRQSSVKNRFTVTSKHRAIALDNLDNVSPDNGVVEGTSDINHQADESKQKDNVEQGLQSDVCQICGKIIHQNKEEYVNDRCKCGRETLKNDAENISAKDERKSRICETTKGAEGGRDTVKVTKEGISTGLDNSEAGINNEGSKHTDTSNAATGINSNDSKHTDTSNAAIGSSGDGPDRTEGMFCLVDLEMDGGPSYESLIRDSLQNQITCNGQPMPREVVSEHRGEGDYVYDIYYTNDRNFDFRMFENDLTFEAVGNEEVWRPELVEDDYVYEDEDEDENAEGNWRNDYPDQDPGLLDNQAMDYMYPEDMAQLGGFDTEATNHLADWMSWRCNLEDGAELSSDENDVDPYDKQGSSHEAYYRRVKKEMEDDKD